MDEYFAFSEFTFISVNLLELEKAQKPIVVTPAGMVMEVREVHSSNA